MKLVLQKISKKKFIPLNKSFTQWVCAVLNIAASNEQSISIVVRIVDEDESAYLNYRYRKKNRPTNVLTFSYNPIFSIEAPISGDIVICAPITIKEANEQNKTIEEHFAHLTVHGVLHLLGYDHKKEKDAKKMEKFEISILKYLGYKNPYMGNFFL